MCAWNLGMRSKPSMALNAKQQEAFDAVSRGGNVFLSGQAGTGKSFTLKHIVAAAYKKWGGVEAVGVTATTGLAALLIGGRTVHSFLGIGLARKSAEELAKDVKSKPFMMKKLLALRLLIIDEISMMDAELLEKISVFLGIVRGKPGKAFGDVQLVICGDLCQLPPVQGAFCFKAPCWKAAKIRTVMLTDSIRQAEDGEFRAMLEELRFGRCRPEVLKRLEACGETVFEGGIEPTVLHSKNVDVDAVNEREYQKVKAKANTAGDDGNGERVFTTRYAGGDRARDWARSIRVAESVALCVGAQVMVTWNVQVAVPVPGGGAGDTTNINLPNGMRGVVVRFGDYPIVRFRSGRELAIPLTTVVNEESKPPMSVTFMPLKLAYAITIHKSQGMTLDAVVMDLGDNIFQDGQAYTALSRARSLDSVRIVAVKAQSFGVHPEVEAFYAATT